MIHRVGKLCAPWLIILAIWQGGCRMCSSPFDGCGPVMDGGRPTCQPGYRAGSILGPQMPAVPPRHAIQEANPLVRKRPDLPSAPRIAGSTRQSPSHLPEQTLLGPPLTLQEMEPFVELGIPPENIISVTDRPLSEVEQSAVAAEPPEERRSSPEKTEIAGHKSLSSTRSPNPTPSADGWIRLGSGATSLRR